jgi:hypothetical protein
MGAFMDRIEKGFVVTAIFFALLGVMAAFTIG